MTSLAMSDPFLIRTVILCGSALVLGGIAVVATGSHEFAARWRVWMIAAPVVIGAAVLPDGVALLALTLGAVAGAETARLLYPDAGGRGRAGVSGAGIAVALSCVAPIALALAHPLGSLFSTGILVATVPAVPWLVRRLPGTDSRRLRAVVAAMLVGVPLAVLATAPTRWVLAAVVSVSFADVAGFVAGKCFGRRGPFARPISTWSPNKTVAGALGSIVVGSATLAFLQVWWLIPLVPVWGILGDLRESRLKRMAGVKDAGNWLPGFGGLLDRIDSVLGAMVGVAVTQVATLLAVAAPIAAIGASR